MPFATINTPGYAYLPPAEAAIASSFCVRLGSLNDQPSSVAGERQPSKTHSDGDDVSVKVSKSRLRPGHATGERWQ